MGRHGQHNSSLQAYTSMPVPVATSALASAKFTAALGYEILDLSHLSWHSVSDCNERAAAVVVLVAAVVEAMAVMATAEFATHAHCVGDFNGRAAAAVAMATVVVLVAVAAAAVVVAIAELAARAAAHVTTVPAGAWRFF